MKRFKICARALTTGTPIVYTVSDTPAEAYSMGKKLSEAGAREVEILDGDNDQYYALPAFAAQHRLR